MNYATAGASSSTSNFQPLLTKEEFHSFRTWWCELARVGALTAEHCLVRALLLGRDPFAAFSPVTNARKLRNGQTAHRGLALALAHVERSPVSHLGSLSRSFAPARAEELNAALGQSARTVFRKEAA